MQAGDAALTEFLRNRKTLASIHFFFSFSVFFVSIDTDYDHHSRLIAQIEERERKKLKLELLKNHEKQIDIYSLPLCLFVLHSASVFICESIFAHLPNLSSSSAQHNFSPSSHYQQQQQQKKKQCK